MKKLIYFLLIVMAVPLFSYDKGRKEESYPKFKPDQNKYDLIHPGITHYPVTIGSRGQFVELNDGSVWITYHMEAHKTFNWLTDDGIIIVSNTSWLTGIDYDYRLINQRTGEEVPVYLNKSLEPTRFKYSISKCTKYKNGFVIILSDNSSWSVTNNVSDWKVGQPIIIGVNQESSMFQNILINPVRKQHVQAFTSSKAI